MKKILLFLLLLIPHCAFASNENLYDFPDVWLNQLVPECEADYKEYYPKNPLPDKYRLLSRQQRLHYCMRMIIKTDDVEIPTWYRNANSRNRAENEYEREIDLLPDDYFLIKEYEDRMNFIGEALTKHYKEKEEAERQKGSIFLKYLGNAVGFVNPPVGMALQAGAN